MRDICVKNVDIKLKLINEQKINFIVERDGSLVIQIFYISVETVFQHKIVRQRCFQPGCLEPINRPGVAGAILCHKNNLLTEPVILCGNVFKTPTS